MEERLTTYPVDLHVHTTASDGTEAPGAVVALAKEVGLHTLAITDHDSIAGVDAALDVGRALGVDVVPAVEISIANEPARDILEVHLLGYFIDHRHPALERALALAAEARMEQKVASIKKMQQLGYDVPMDEVLELANGGSLGRAHIAQVTLAHNPERFSDVDEIIRGYISLGGRAYVPRRFQLRLDEAIHLIRQAGGMAVLAHPKQYRKVVDLPGLIRHALTLGLAGLEVRYPYMTEITANSAQALTASCLEIATRLGLAVTGGSDYHGSRKSNRLGQQGLSMREYRALRRAHGLSP